MIRLLQHSDLTDLLELYEHLHRKDEPLPPLADIKSHWAAILANPDLLYFGKFAGDALVSSCTLSLIPNLTRGCRPYGIIENVVTHARHRKKGYGRAVLQHALEFAWTRKCYKVMLLTGRKEEQVYRFYESVGFDRYAKQGFVALQPPEFG